MKKPKITHKHLMIVVLVLGAFLIALGILYAVFDFKFDPEFMKNASNVVVVIALVIFVWSRKIAKDNETEARKKQEDEEAAKAADAEASTEAASSADAGASADDARTESLEDSAKKSEKKDE